MLRHQQDDVECDASIFKARKKTNIKGRGVSQSPRLMATYWKAKENRDIANRRVLKHATLENQN